MPVADYTGLAANGVRSAASYAGIKLEHVNVAGTDYLPAYGTLHGVKGIDDAANTQDYGLLYVYGGAGTPVAEVIMDGCHFTGNVTDNIDVSASVTNVYYVTDITHLVRNFPTS